MSERLVLLNANYSNHNPEQGNVPPREEAIRKFIKSQKKAENEPGKATVVLIDTIWGNRFGEDRHETGENEALARHLGMRAAFHTLVDDAKLNQDEWKKGVGITVATDHTVKDSEIVRLGSSEKARNALLVDMQIGDRALTLAAVYLPETDPTAQLEQVEYLATKLKDDPMPSEHRIVAGDFNALDEAARYHGILPKIGNAIVHWGAKRAEHSVGKSYRDEVFRTLNERHVVPFMRSLGYTNAGACTTYPSEVPLLDPDHVFLRHVHKDAVRTVKGLSDHRAIVLDFDLQ